MRAVNLLPAESRRSSTPLGRSGGAAHALLGLLGLAVLAVAVLALAGRQVEERRAELARVQAEAQAVEARAGTLGPYREFARRADTRATRVRELAAARVDWSFALTEVARVLPRGVRLTALTATVAPGAGGAAGDPLRGGVPNPAVELTGCAPSQERTALLLSRLRTIDGVERVALSTSAKAEGQEVPSAAPAGASAAGADCRAGSDRIPQFGAVVFLRPARASTAGAAAPATGAPAAQPTTTDAAQ